MSKNQSGHSNNDISWSPVRRDAAMAIVELTPAHRRMQIYGNGRKRKTVLLRLCPGKTVYLIYRFNQLAGSALPSFLAKTTK